MATYTNNQLQTAVLTQLATYTDTTNRKQQCWLKWPPTQIQPTANSIVDSNGHLHRNNQLQAAVLIQNHNAHTHTATTNTCADSNDHTYTQLTTVGRANTDVHTHNQTTNHRQQH